MTAQGTLKWLFWVAFAVFLAASIPHVAYFFKSFEPDGLWCWFIAYALAVVIDITTFLLSMTVAELQRKKTKTVLILSVWVFIVGLAFLSWLMNWEYAVQFQSAMLSKASAIAWVARYNPIIASCFQALAIAYTWISDKLLASGEIADGKPAIVTQEFEIAEIADEIPAIPEIARNCSKQEILAFIQANPDVQGNEIAEKFHVSPSTISRWKKEIA